VGSANGGVKDLQQCLLKEEIVRLMENLVFIIDALALAG